MSSKERFLYIALLLLSSVFISYLFFSEDESYVEQYNFEIKKLEQKNITVIVKKNKIFNSKIVNHIENNWEIYEEGEYFNVYKKVNN